MTNEPKTTQLADIPRGLPEGFTLENASELQIAEVAASVDPSETGFFREAFITHANDLVQLNAKSWDKAVLGEPGQGMSFRGQIPPTNVSGK